MLIVNRLFRLVYIILERAICFIFRRIPFSSSKRLLQAIFNEYEMKSDEYISYKVHYKKADFFVPSDIETKTENGELAIVIQGPIEMKDDFTIETIKLYKKLFSGAIIICSTWNDTPEDVLKKIKELDCYLIVSEFFEENGFSNINYQIKTTYEGVKKAKELGAKYVLKNRADIRVYKEFSFEYLKNLLELFPIKIDVNSPFNLKGRIITVQGSAGQMFMPYWLQDFIYFGYTEDVLNFFDIPYDHRVIKDRIKFQVEKFGSCPNGEDISKIPAPEIYLTKAFLEKYQTINYSVESSWDIIKRFFLIIDFEDLNLFWVKYQKQRNLSRLYREPGLHNLEDFYDYKVGDSMDPYKNITFVDFVNLYMDTYKYDRPMEMIKKNRRLN